MTGVVIGTRGSPWRATVTPAGAVVSAAGEPALDWWVAADDRWHLPADEPSRRQRRMRGAPVVETTLAVPSGDVVHRAYAVPVGAGAATVIELENRSPLPVAVAFSRSDVATGRPVASVPAGAPPGAIVAVPLGHRSTVRVVVGATPPSTVPAADQVARGWVTQTETGVRFVVPDDALLERVVAARCDALLTVPSDDPGARLLVVAERVRLGEPPAPWVEDVAGAAVAVARRARRAPGWDDGAALDAAADVLRRAGEAHGADDVDAMRARLGPTGPAPAVAPEGSLVVPWLMDRLVHGVDGGADLLGGFTPEWAGHGIEVYGAPVGPATLGVAVRWHGERPALLWESSAGLRLTCSTLDPTWSSDAPRGEALLRPYRP